VRAEKPALGQDDWYKLGDQDEVRFFTDRGCAKVAIKARRGSLVLWDSRLFHQGVEQQQGRAQAHTRLVTYVCMTPRQWSDPKQMAKKRKAFLAARTTSHWPHQIKLFGKSPRTYGRPLPDMEPVLPLSMSDLTPLGRRLAGFDSEDTDESVAAKR
jgi:hypothetical protein